MSDASHRLPTNVQPRRYDLHVTCAIDRERFEGEVVIDVDVVEPTDRVVLHADDLHIASVAVTQDGREQDARHELDEERQRLTLILDRALEPGDALLELAWSAAVRQDMTGLYLARDGDDVCLATQGESTYARRILPCFDEPSFKSVFEVRVTTEPGPIVLSNMPLDGKMEGDGGLVTWRFEPTPLMSSYLLAFVVGDFEASEPVEVRGVPFRSWAMGSKVHQGTRGRDIAARCLPWYEDYFGTPYAFGKYDQVAIPSFAFGAMENAGLVTFRPNALLLDEATAAWGDVKWVDAVVAHELAHMWFGNLTTMAWWDDLWLNEAFADWICHKIVDELEPTHEVWIELLKRSDRGKDIDSLASTHAVYTPVDTAHEAEELFDMVTYGKGSHIMRMVEAYLGEDAFREGLRGYMAEFAEANARGEDLWRHLEAASDEPVREIMRSWIEQPGHPIVRTRLDGDGTTLHLEQERFVRTGREVEPATWRIPLVLRVADEVGVRTTSHLLTESNDAVDLDLEGTLRWVHVNADDGGPYRQAPSPELLSRLEDHLGELTAVERRSLVRDEADLVLAGGRRAGRYLRFLERLLPSEDHFAVLDEAYKQLTRLERLLEQGDDPATLRAFRGWLAETVGRNLRKLPEPHEDPAEVERKAALWRLGGVLAGGRGVLEEAREAAERDQASPGEVDGTLADAAVRATARHGDDETWVAHLTTYEERRDAGASPQELNRYLYSLRELQAPELVERTLDLLATDRVPNQDVGPMLVGMLVEPHSQSGTWPWVRENWGEITSRVGGSWTARIVEAAGHLHPRHREEVATFFEEVVADEAPQSRARALEELEARARDLPRVTSEIAAWAQGRA